jgi:cobalamin-dependent methionine synthase I
VILIAENLTVADPAVARAVAERDPGPLVALVELARRAGARFLDVNLGAGGRGRGENLRFVLDVVASAWDGGILVDTPDPGVMAEALTLWQGRGEVVLNGFSGDPEREQVLEVAAGAGASVVVFLLAGGLRKSVDERLALAAELVERCLRHGIGLERLWIDPVVAPLGWTEGQEFDAALLEVVRQLPAVLGDTVGSIVGLSNLTTASTGGRPNRWIQEVFLALAAGAGLTHAMVDVRNRGLVRVARAIEALEGRRVYAEADFA